MRKILIFISFILFIQNTDAQCLSGNCKDGKGVFKYPSGAKYTGDFRKGEIHGMGFCVYSDGSRYEGQWASRYPEGKGTKTLKDGSKLTGTWKKGVLMDGQEIKANGAILVAKGKQDGDGTTVQSGCINGDCENGQGTYAFPDGSKYDGQFAAGKIHGYGTFYYANGDKYVGSFKVNVAHGKGTIFHADSTQTTGEWNEGEYVGSKIIEAGRMGCVDGDCVNGKGTYIYTNGEAKYIGQFKNKLPHGRGSVLYANGERFIGNWENGSFNGKGTLYMTDGTTVKGFWKDGEYIGKEEVEKDAGEIIAQKNAQKTDNQQVKESTNTEKLNVFALVVGVSSYTHMPVLRYTDDDAYRMFAFLKSPEGGALADDHIKILIDEEATHDNIVTTMQKLFAKAGPKDLVVLYFSGHGLKGSFLPIDYDGYENKLEHEEISQIFKQSPAKYKLCIADACHSGSLLAMKGASAENTLATYYETLANAKSGTALIMSSKSEESSLESSGLRQGVFSHFLIRGLKGEADANENSVISVQELFDFVGKNVESYTDRRQTPVIQGDYDPEMTVAVKRK
jgi:uncharacterized caspase-like protein